MKIELTWLAHNCWRLTLGKTVFIVDPFLLLPVSAAKEQSVEADYLLVSHGHADHCASALTIAKRCGSTVAAMAEAAGWFEKNGVSKTEPMNIGGTGPLKAEDENGKTVTIRVMMTPALHSSTMPDGKPGGNSSGFLVIVPNSGADPWSGPVRPMKETLADCRTIYFACDTGWFSEMEKMGDWGIDTAVLPIGDRYTSGAAMSLDMILSLKPKRVIPGHFNSWPPIAQNAEQWAEAVRNYTSALPVVLKPGESVVLD